MVYQYLAYNESGELVRGRLSAVSEEVATELLSYAGYQAVNLKQYVPFLKLDNLLNSFLRVKPAEIILFYRELAMLLEAGIDIAASLELLQSQASTRALRRVLGEVISDLRSGNQLSVALGRHPRVFSPIYCRLLYVGEQSGDLEKVLTQIADYMEKEADIGKDIKNALMYPIITSGVTVVVLGLLVTFVLPAFGDLYSSLGIELPVLAQILITTANNVQNYGLYLVLALSVVIVAALIYIKTPGGRYRWDKLTLSLPVFGRINHLTELSRYCRSMSLLFRAGLPSTEVMSLVVHGSGNRAMSKALIDVQQDMVQGEGLSRPMLKSSLFLPMMVQMVRVGEETGNLDVTLLAVARSYEAEAADRTRSLVALIQPAMTLVIGLVIAVIALALTSAMYSMYGQEGL